MQSCPLQKLAHDYDQLAARWSATRDCQTWERLLTIVNQAERLNPESVTGATFLLSCALAEVDAITNGSVAPHHRLARERRVQTLLRRAVVFFAERSDDVSSTWKLRLPASERHIKRAATSARMETSHAA